MTTLNPPRPDEREELARVLRDAHQGDGCKSWDDEEQAWRDTYRDMADAVIAAGWTRTPRPVTVADEVVLRALRFEEERLSEIVDSASPFMSQWGADRVSYAEYDLRQLRAFRAPLPHLSSGQSEATLRDDRGVIAAERNEAQRRLEQVEAERDSLATAMWIAYCILGFDTDGDESPASWIAGSGGHQQWAESWLREIRHHRADLEDERDEAERIEIQRDAALAVIERVRKRAVEYREGQWGPGVDPLTQEQAERIADELTALLPDTPTTDEGD